MRLINARFIRCLFVAAALVFIYPRTLPGSVDMTEVNGSAGQAFGGSGQADPLMGNFNYSVPIKVAPGRQRAEPSLSLNYGSGGGNGWCGVGWSLDVGYIQRDTRKGVPIKWNLPSATPQKKYDDSKGFIAKVGGMSGELVLVDSTSNPIIYRRQVESSFLTFKWYTDNHWEAVDKSGNTFYFGQGTTNRMDNPKTGWTANAESSTFKWVLNKVIDVNGNQTILSYTKDGGQLYLTNISYNANTNSPALPATHTVDFVLTNRSDTNITFLSGYKVETAKLLSEIHVKVSGANVRRYVLGYTNSVSTTRSLLSSVTEYGSDFATTLPPLTFAYQIKPFEFESSTEWLISSQGNTDAGWNAVRGISDGDSHAIMMDIDADGLPDRVMRKLNPAFTNYFAVQRNTGSGFAPATTNYHWGPLDNSQSAAKSWNSPIGVNAGATVVDMVDINGDGYPDRVASKINSPHTNFFVYLNTGISGDSGFASNSVLWGPVTNTVTAVTDEKWLSIRYKTAVDFMDFNGDGLPDRVSRRHDDDSSWDRFKVQLNTGSGFTTPVDWSPLDSQGDTTIGWNSLSAATSGNVYVVSLDINGDGLVDRVMRKISGSFTNFLVQFNNGAGFEPAHTWGGVIDNQGSSSGDWGSPIGSNGSGVWATLVDINGDGLVDRVMRKRSSPFTNWVVQINTGAGFAEAKNWGPIDNNGGGTGSTWNNISHRTSDSDTYVDFMDINGDSLPDRVMRRNDGPYDRYIIQLNKGPFPDLLNSVKNGLGGDVQVSYIASTTLDNRDTNWVSDPWAEGTKSLMPFNTWVVSQVSVSDGMGQTNSSTYAYKGGYFNAQKREFRGFSQVEVTDPLETKTRTYYHQSGGRDNTVLGEYQDQNSVAKKGIPFRVEIIGSDGATNKITLSKVEEVELHTNGWYFPFVSQTIVMDYEGSSSYRATAKQLLYETNTGNLVKDISLGEVTNINFVTHGFDDVGSDSLYTHFTYLNLANVKTKPTNIKVTSDIEGNSRLKESILAYDSRGNITNSRVWLDTAGGFITVASTTYDQYGNPVQTTDAAGIASAIVYDSTYKQYGVKQITGTFTNQFTHDARSGTLLTGIDPKGLVSSNSYDVFFRATETFHSVTPFGDPILWRTRIDYVLNGTGQGISTNYVRNRVNDALDGVNGYETYTYHDGLGRTIQSRSEAENGEYRVTDTIYDERGASKYQTMPYFSSGPDFTALGGTHTGTLTEYDPIGRAFRVTPAVEATFGSNRQLNSTNATGGDTGSPVAPVTTAFSENGDPWVSIVIDSENKVKKSFHDARGRIIKVTEVTTSGSYSTTYGYDILGNLTNVTDNASNSTVIAYDNLGRKMSMTDLDMGTWTYAYDNSGRMIQQVDARNNKLKFYFNDQLGRLTSKEIYNSSNQLTGTITYTYDISDDPNYTVFKGQLYKISDLEGTQKTSYDFRGRVLKSARLLNLNSMEYVTQSVYDDADRVQQVIYPGNAATIKYTYDTAGNMIQVRSLTGTGTQEIFYSSPTFNELGQVTSYTYGNGVVTTNLFYANSKRAKGIKAFIGTTNHQEFSYTFDAVSNLKSISDPLYTASLTNIVYDDLHRLLSVHSPTRGTKAYSYDSIGNMLLNQDYGPSNYVYGAKPHAVTSANGKDYSYDACGNMIMRGSQTLAYDEENQLVRADNVRFGYADGGSRLWRSGTNGYSVWIGGIYEINNGKVLCHVFAGGQRVATFEPQCGGPWAKVVGEDRFFAYTSGFEKALNWPFQQGRTPFTMLAITFAGMMCIAMGVRRRVCVTQYEMRRAWRSGLLWKQAVTFTSIIALVLATTENVEAQTYTPVFHYYHSDHLGSSSVLTDRTGGLAQQYEYSAFGQSTVTENATVFSPSNRYTGQILDEETGLYYYNARYYDPELGRFIQADTIVPSAANPQSFNRYSYCQNNPLKYVDPSGHSIIGAIIVGASYVIAGAAIGAATAYATGGDIWKGAISGAISGYFAGLGAGLGAMIGGAGGAFAGAVAGGAAGGAATAAVTGGDIGMGALTGAIAGGIGFGVGQLQIGMWGGATPGSWVDDLTGFASSAAGGALGGGVGSVLYGGDFWDGAAAGAIGGAIGYAIAVDLPDGIRNSASADPRFHLFLGIIGDALGGFGALVTGQEGAWSGFGEGLRDGAGGEVDAITFGTVKGAFGSDVNSSGYSTGKIGGTIARDSLMTATGTRGIAAVGRTPTRIGHWLNQGRHIRIGGGPFPKATQTWQKWLTYGTGQKVPSIRIGNAKPQWWNHIDLRVLGH